MSIIKITREELWEMEDIYNSNVYLKNGIIYKCDTESEQVIKKIHQLGNHPYLKQIVKPIDFLELEKEYFGYTMLYYNTIKKVNEAIKQGTIKNLGDFFDELFMIITKLNTLKLIYWDFHENNIFSDENGHPFIIDLDDIEQEPSDTNLLEQKEYLTEFLLGTYTEQYHGYYWYFKTTALKDILNKEANEYLEMIRNGDPTVKEMPYSVLTELEDQDKTNALKLALK